MKKTAVDLASDLNPDLVIMDIMLPILDGFEVCRILRKDSNSQYQPLFKTNHGQIWIQ